MKILLLFIFALLYMLSISVHAAADDSLIIHNLGHASVMLEFDGKVIHIDPRVSEADYASLPDADIICITHEHSDHYDLKAINQIEKESTVMVLTQTVKDLNSYDGECVVMINGDSVTLKGIAIEAVASYNIDDGNGAPRHVKGVGNGYIFTFNDLRVLLAGDTQNIPEMATFDVDIAFIPMNQPYTMTSEMAADAAKTLNPQVLYIYHYDPSYVNTFKELLQDEEMEIRIGDSKFIEATIINESSALSPNFSINECIIYPNPSKGLIMVEQQAKSAGFNVFDMNGRLMFEKTDLVKGCNPIDLQMLNSGTYLVGINTVTSPTLYRRLCLIK